MSGSRPLGYIETQVSWVGAIDHMEQNRNIAGARDSFLRENVGYQVVDMRIDTTMDGAGIPHYNVYLGFAPIKERAPPLNQRNLNDAPPPRVGELPAMPDDATGVPLGWREQQFGRGTT